MTDNQRDDIDNVTIATNTIIHRVGIIEKLNYFNPVSENINDINAANEIIKDRREFVKEIENSLAIIKGVYNIKK